MSWSDDNILNPLIQKGITYQQKTKNDKVKNSFRGKKKLPEQCLYADNVVQLYLHKTQGKKGIEDYFLEIKPTPSSVSLFGRTFIKLQKKHKYDGDKKDKYIENNQDYLSTNSSATLRSILDKTKISELNKKKIYLHRLVYNLNNPNISIEGKHIHHIDYNSMNNHKDNLMCLEANQHHNLHKLSKILGYLVHVISVEDIVVQQPLNSLVALGENTVPTSENIQSKRLILYENNGWLYSSQKWGL